MSNHVETLVATLGGQPQIITFTLDLLLQRGFSINEVIVIHPKASQSRLQRSLEILNAEFIGDRYRVSGQIMHFRSHVLQFAGELLDDIVDETSANGALNAIHRLIRNLKYQQRCIHLSISGGRRLMSSIAVEAALLNFTHSDHIWHIHTPEAVQRQADEGAIMHLPRPNEIHLIERPFVPWNTYFPELPQASNSAQDALTSQKRARNAQEHARCEQVAQQATRRERDVLRAFADGCTPQEAADRLSITTRTVDAHKTRLLEYCREVWEIESDTSRLGYHFLFKTFAPYFSEQQE